MKIREPNSLGSRALISEESGKFLSIAQHFAAFGKLPLVQNAPFRTGIDTTRATNRCVALKANGLISGATSDDMAASALDALIAAGWEPEHNELHASHYAFATPAIMATYSNAD